MKYARSNISLITLLCIFDNNDGNRFWSEAQSQRDALSAAVYNLKDHAIALESNFDEVVKALDKQESRHQGLLDSFEVKHLRNYC